MLAQIQAAQGTIVTRDRRMGWDWVPLKQRLLKQANLSK